MTNCINNMTDQVLYYRVYIYIIELCIFLYVNVCMFVMLSVSYISCCVEHENKHNENEITCACCSVCKSTTFAIISNNI